MRFQKVFAVLGVCAAAASAQYCTPTGSGNCTGGDEFISNVTFSGINNNTACSPVPHYTYFPTSAIGAAVVAPGAAMPISVTISTYWSGDQIQVYLDENANNTFDYPTELIATLTGPGVSGGNQVLTGTANIPPTMVVGVTTRLRVRLLYFPAAGDNSCSANYFSECQDFDAIAPGSSVPDYQVNQLGSSMDIDGVVGGPYALASKTVCTGVTANVNLSSTATSLPWDILISPIGPLTPATGAITTANGQIVNCNLAATTFLFNLALNVPFANQTIPVNLPFTIDALLQMVNIDPSNPDGISLSQPNFFHVSAGALLIPGPTTDDGVVVVTAGTPGQCMPAIPFYSQTYTQYHVCSNGRVMFQPPGAAAPATGSFQPTLGGGLNETFAGFWLDFQPGTPGTGTIDITSPAPGLVSIVYNNQNYWGNPSILVSGSITFDTTNGAVTLSGMASWPVFPVTSGTYNVCFMGVTPGVLGSTNGTATDPGATAYSLGGSGGPAGPTSDMIYALGNPNLLSGNANSLVYIPNAMGNFFWAGF